MDSRPGLKGDEGQDDGDSDFDAGASSKKSKKDKRGKKRKAKDSKKSSKKKKKRKANSDLSDNEGGEPVEDEEEEQDYTPKAKSKKGAKKSADSSPAPTPQATNDEAPSVEEVCENFGLNDVNLDYSDADYQNLTTYKMFQQAYRSRIQSANPKVPQPKLTMLLAAKWREFQTARAKASEAEEESEEKIESAIRSDFQISKYNKTLSLSLRNTELAEESEEKKCLPVPEMTVELDNTPA